MGGVLSIGAAGMGGILPKGAGASGDQISTTRRGPLQPDTQTITTSPRCCSAGLSSPSRWSISPEITRVSQVLQTPSLQL